jgi:hypothetical protein
MSQRFFPRRHLSHHRLPQLEPLEARYVPSSVKSLPHLPNKAADLHPAAHQVVSDARQSVVADTGEELSTPLHVKDAPGQLRKLDTNRDADEQDTATETASHSHQDTGAGGKGNGHHLKAEDQSSAKHEQAGHPHSPHALKSVVVDTILVESMDTTSVSSTEAITLQENALTDFGVSPATPASFEPAAPEPDTVAVIVEQPHEDRVIDNHPVNGTAIGAAASHALPASPLTGVGNTPAGPREVASTRRSEVRLDAPLAKLVSAAFNSGGSPVGLLDRAVGEALPGQTNAARPVGGNNPAANGPERSSLQTLLANIVNQPLSVLPLPSSLGQIVDGTAFDPALLEQAMNQFLDQVAGFDQTVGEYLDEPELWAWFFASTALAAVGTEYLHRRWRRRRSPGVADNAVDAYWDGLDNAVSH